MSTKPDPFSQAPDTRDFAGRVPDDDARDVLTSVECGECGEHHDSARSALDCNHNHE